MVFPITMTNIWEKSVSEKKVFIWDNVLKVAVHAQEIPLRSLWGSYHREKYKALPNLLSHSGELRETSRQFLPLIETSSNQKSQLISLLFLLCSGMSSHFLSQASLYLHILTVLNPMILRLCPGRETLLLLPELFSLLNTEGLSL